MPEFVLSPRAQEDVREILDYLKSRSAEAARKVSAELEGAMTLLAEFPGMGHVRRDLTHRDLLFWSVYSYLIVYRPGTTPLEVHRVLHGARDVANILRRSNEPG